MQQQADALQALRAEVDAQVAGGLQQQADALQALRAEVGAQGAGGLQQQADALQALRLEAEKGAAERDARMVEGERTIARLKTESILQERRITLLLEEARKRLPDPWNQEQLQSVADEVNHVLDALYVSFEDQFRGTREDIKERLRLYLPILQEAKLGSETGLFWTWDADAGNGWSYCKRMACGGKAWTGTAFWLRNVRGVDFAVVESDVLTYLRTLPDASLGAVTGFHIIEHLPWEVLIKVLDETVRVLISGGCGDL